MNNHQSAYLPMVFPAPSAPPSGEEPPPRVLAAMAFLNQLTQKTAAKCAVNDISIEWHEGPKLLGHEVAAQIAACDLLTDYFRGKMKPDRFERLPERGLTGMLELDGVITGCPACAGVGQVGAITCMYCKGRGRALISALPNSLEESQCGP